MVEQLQTLHFSNLTHPGTYALILQASEHMELKVGRLGWLHVIPGFYIYAGSAFGPGGLRARLSRHLGKPVTRHWHIDTLRPVTQPWEVWVTFAPETLEHAWALALRSLPQAVIPLPGFGSSDCRCISHLVYLPDKPDIGDFRASLTRAGCPPTTWDAVCLAVSEKTEFPVK